MELMEDRVVMKGEFEEKWDKDKGDANEGKIQPEYPTLAPNQWVSQRKMKDAAYPSHFLCECTTNDWPCYRTQRPHCTDDTEPLASKPQRDNIRHHDLGQSYEPSAAHPLQRPSNKQYAEVRTCSAHDCPSEEKNKTGQDHGLPAEYVGEGGETGLKDSRAKEKGGPGPEGLNRRSIEVIGDILQFLSA